MKSDLEALGRLRRQAVLLLAGVFVIGGLVGAAFVRLLDLRSWPVAAQPVTPPPGLPPELERELALTPEQHRHVEEIFARSRPRADAIMGEFVPRLRAITDSVRIAVRAVLDPRQREILDRWQGPPPGAHRGHPDDQLRPQPFGAPPGPPPEGRPDSTSDPQVHPGR